ncbi:MAG: hypothetical protein R3D00_19225 [Bacteroidia bacterium]
MPEFHLIPECFADTEMVRIIFKDLESCNLNHASGISEVSKALQKKDLPNYLNIGFVDKDRKNVPFYLDEFEIVEQVANVAFKKHPTSNDYLFIVDPAIERFLLQELAEINKPPSDYQLPDDFKNFKKTLKKTHIQNHLGYKHMVSDLLEAETTGITFMRKMIRGLLE